MSHFKTVILIERNEISIVNVKVSSKSSLEISKRLVWDPSLFLEDRDGTRLIEEIVRKVNTFWKDTTEGTTVLISLPGTLKNHKELISSSRIGIREPSSFGLILEKKLKKPCFLFHDTDAICMGEITYGNYFKDKIPNSIIYVLIDEGIGSKIYIDGKVYDGSGTAGLLGRLIVQPDGAYYPTLRSSGALEVYSSRPGVSKRLVELYHSETKKKIHGVIDKPKKYSKFRQALETASKTNSWEDISYSRIADGIKEDDSLAIQVLDQASKYLGFALNSVITILNPNLIILGGKMISEIPEFAECTLTYVRQFSWPSAWNNTTIEISNSNRDLQIYGCVELHKSIVS